MTNDDISEIAVEVSCILERFPSSFFKRIPQDFIDIINSFKSNTYTFIYDDNKTLKEQNLKAETKGVIAYIYENFCCSDEEKEQYQKRCRKFERKKDEEARIKYNIDNIFTKKTNNMISENNILDNSNTPKFSNEKNIEMVEYKKEKWYHKVLKRILKFF